MPWEKKNVGSNQVPVLLLVSYNRYKKLMYYWIFVCVKVQ